MRAKPSFRATIKRGAAAPQMPDTVTRKSLGDRIYSFAVRGYSEWCKLTRQRRKEIMNQDVLLCTLVTNAWKEPNHVWMDNTYNITCILRTAYLGYDRVGIY